MACSVKWARHLNCDYHLTRTTLDSLKKLQMIIHTLKCMNISQIKVFLNDKWWSHIDDTNYVSPKTMECIDWYMQWYWIIHVRNGVQALIASVESQLLMKVCAVMPRLVLRLWIHCHFKNVVRVRVLCFQSTGVIKKIHWPALKRRAECHQPSPLNVSKD